MKPTSRDRPRILYLTRVYPYRPAFGGEITYSNGIVRHLAHACNLTVLAATNGVAPIGEHDADGAHWHLVPASTRFDALSLLTPMPNIMWRNATPAYHARLRALLARGWSAVILDHFASAHVVPALLAWRRRQPGRRILYLSHEHERTARSEKYASYGGNPLRRAVMRYDGWKIGRWEDRTLAAADVISLINPGERHLFERHVAGKRFIVATPGYDGERRQARRIDGDVPRRVAVLGGRGSLHKQNILRRWLAAADAPLAAAGIAIDVIGDLPPALLGELARNHPSVRFSGYVEALGEHLQGSRIGLVPDMVGRGVKVRLPSYIFARLPMAGLAGAIDGLPLVAGRDFREAASPEELVSLCLHLIDDLPELNRLQESAFRACDRALDWHDRAEAIVAALVDHRPRYGADTPPVVTASAIA